MSENGGGDCLARGAKSHTFQPAGSKTSQEAWDDIFKDFDAEKYRRNADVPPSGIPSAVPGETSEDAGV